MRVLVESGRVSRVRVVSGSGLVGAASDAPVASRRLKIVVGFMLDGVILQILWAGFIDRWRCHVEHLS
jgi:hypothetical protein